MPYSPCCNQVCGMYENGFVCPRCMQLYSFVEGRTFRDYDGFEVVQAQLLFLQLHSQNVLQFGMNKVEFCFDGLIISHLDDIF